MCVWGDEDLTSPTSVLNTKGPLECVRHCCADRNIVATGGKENDLSLWNLETQQTVFQAKNVSMVLVKSMELCLCTLDINW